MIDPATLQAGDRVYSDALCATPFPRAARVDDITTNYISLHWERSEHAHHNDILLKTSPLWALLELVP